MLRMLARLTVVVCALWASQALALGLGDINVRSKLNQPFSATIAVLGASSAQLDSLTVKLAGADEFNRAGIDRSDYLSSLKFNVEEAGGGARVTISSDQIAREPFLNFIIEARSPDGKLLREYTVLLDPPTMADSSAPAASSAPATSYVPPPAPVVQVPGASPHRMAPAEAAALASEPQGPGDNPKHGKGKTKPAKPAAPVAAAAPAEPAPMPAPQAAAAPAAATGSSGSYGPIAPQETFWSIATKLRPGPQVSMDQVLLAIYRANPQAFDKGSFNGLLKGHTLQVPSAAEMQESSAAQAKAAVDAWRHGTRPAASLKKNPEAAVPVGSPAPAKADKPKPVHAKPAKPAKPVVEAKPEAAAPAPVAPVAAAPTPPPVAAPAPPKPEPAPAPAVAATPPPAAPSTPAPAAATSASPAPAASTAAAPSPAPAAPAADTATAEPPKKKVLPPPPPPPAGLFEDSTTQMELAGVVVLLIGVMGWFIFRRRKEVVPDFRAKAPPSKTPLLGSKPPAAAPPKKAGPPAPPPLPQPAKPQLQPQPSKLGDTTALPEDIKPTADQTALFSKPLPSEPPLAKTALEDTTQVKMADTLLPVPSFEQTSKTQAAQVGGGDVDFDLTSQFEAQTLSINLDANDPLSEADFHLAYGLYDEAASLLKQALGKEPQRQDLRLKLAETYFAGGKPMEFQETAESLHGQISASDWQKIAIMGRQLCPDSSLFKSDGSAPAPDIDLSLGDSIGPAPAQVLGAPPSRPAASQGNVIDFDLDAELSKAGPVEPMAAAPSASDKADFDLSHFDFSAEPPHPAGTEGTIEFDLDELDLSKPAGGGHVSSGDEIGTKLDLARVYADMGDNEAARGLLNEVLGTGNAAQKGEAEALIKRLSA